MSRDEVLALVARLDPGATIETLPDGRPVVFASAAMTFEALHELMREAPGTEVTFGGDSALLDDMSRVLETCRPTGPSYELDDLNEDGSWKAGHPPVGWGELP